MPQTQVTGRAGLAALKGSEIGPGEWFTVDQARIDRFAEAVDDNGWIHVDRERAKSSRWGTTIAQGYLTTALIPVLLRRMMKVEGFSSQTNMGANRIRFPGAVPSGSRLRLKARLADLEPVKGGVQATFESTIEVEGADRPGCVAEMVFRYFD